MEPERPPQDTPSMSDLRSSPFPVPGDADPNGGGSGGRPVLTSAEVERHQERLAELRRIRDDDLPELLRAARQLVAADAAEEIMQMQADHAVVAARIGQLEDLLSDARVVDVDAVAADRVAPGRTVTLRYVRTGREVRLLVGEGAGDDAVRAASVRSPVGQAIVGRCVGDLVAVDLPDGRREELLVVSVSDGGAARAA
jgi:transcription elongation factor GreA